MDIPKIYRGDLFVSVFKIPLVCFISKKYSNLNEAFEEKEGLEKYGRCEFIQLFPRVNSDFYSKLDDFLDSLDPIKAVDLSDFILE